MEEKLQHDANSLLHAYLRGDSVQQFLHSLPQYLPGATLHEYIGKFRSAVQTLLRENISSAAAMQTTL